MPIRPENRDRYPDDWAEISHEIRFNRAGGRCECTGECGRPYDHLDRDERCRNRHGQPAYGTGSKVVLTCAHLDHTPENCDPANLAAMCQGCHLHYDRDHHAQTRAATRHAEDAALAGLLELCDWCSGVIPPEPDEPDLVATGGFPMPPPVGPHGLAAGPTLCPDCNVRWQVALNLGIDIGKGGENLRASRGRIRHPDRYPDDEGGS